MFFRISSSICALLLVVVALNGCGGKAPEAADNKPASADGGGGLTLPDKPIEAPSAAAPAASEPAPSAPEPAAAAAPVGVKPDDVMATLEKLGELKTKGILTQEEFDTKKAKLLKKLV